MCTPVLSPLDRVPNARLIRPGNRPVRYGAVNLHGDEAEVSLRRTLPLPKDTEMRGGTEFGQPRSLAGKPLAGFRTTTGRRITVVYGMIVYAIRFNNPPLRR